MPHKVLTHAIPGSTKHGPCESGDEIFRKEMTLLFVLLANFGLFLSLYGWTDVTFGRIIILNGEIADVTFGRIMKLFRTFRRNSPHEQEELKIY